MVQPAVANPEEMGYSGLYAAILSNVNYHFLAVITRCVCQLV